MQTVIVSVSPVQDTQKLHHITSSPRRASSHCLPPILPIHFSYNIPHTIPSSPPLYSQLTPKNAATSAANTLTSTATSVVDQAASYTGLSSTHPHAEEHQHSSTILPDSTLGEIKTMDPEGLEVFENERVRHEILVKMNQLEM